MARTSPCVFIDKKVLRTIVSQHFQSVTPTHRCMYLPTCINNNENVTNNLRYPIYFFIIYTVPTRH